MTNVAMTIMKQAILTFLGITVLRREMSMLEQTRTKVTATPIPSPLSTLLLIARVGQSPKTRRYGGTSAHKPFLNS